MLTGYEIRHAMVREFGNSLKRDRPRENTARRRGLTFLARVARIGRSGKAGR